MAFDKPVRLAVPLTGDLIVLCNSSIGCICMTTAYKKVQVGNDQEKAGLEKDSHSKNHDG